MLAGEAKKRYQREYMRRYMRIKRTGVDTKGTLLRPNVKTPVTLGVEPYHTTVTAMSFDADGQPIYEEG